MTTKRSEFGSLADRAAQDDKVRHVWVTLPRGRFPGVVLEWRRRQDVWQARVAVASDDDGGLVVRWVPATHLDPVGDQRPRSARG